MACKTLSNLVRRSAISGLTGLEDGGGSINVQGEEQKKLDVISNDVLKNALRWSGELATLASEEEDVPVSILDNGDFSSEIIVENSGRYVAVFDPLDGSSNVDAGIPVGTIFGIFDSAECSVEDMDFDDDIEKLEEKCLQDTLQPGTNLVAAGYCLYSSATSFVFTLGSGVYGFTLDENIGEFVLTHPDLKIPPRGKIYSFNEANRWDWDPPLQKYVTDIQQGLVSTIQIDGLFNLVFQMPRSNSLRLKRTVIFVNRRVILTIFNFEYSMSSDLHLGENRAILSIDIRVVILVQWLVTFIEPYSMAESLAILPIEEILMASFDCYMRPHRWHFWWNR